VSGSGKPAVLLTGSAEGLGESIAETFATAGYDIIGLSRSDRATASIAQRVNDARGCYLHLTCDVTRPSDVADVLRPHAESIGVLIHNAHSLLIKPFEQTDAAEFEHVWRVACLGAMAAAQAVLPPMAERGNGTIIFTGATAGIRGSASFSAFASAKFALRGLAQSLAREYGQRGVHVAHVILDGLIDEAQTNERFGPAQNLRMGPNAIARSYLALASQPPSAWTHEMDLRPFLERF